MMTNMVLEEAERFWNNESRYRKHNLLYKRGIILFGPPGSGKTVTIKLLMQKLVNRGGIIIVVQNVPLAAMCLKAVKRIEPTRNMICIFEDIDEILHANGESHVLSMLDGEHNVDRVMNIATTNYPERLGARIINRPSRFDRRVFIDMPGPEAREYYLQKATGGTLSPDELVRWVRDTNEMSIAHLRELVAAVYCLDQPYDEVVQRLSDMAKAVKAADEFKRGGLGFGATKSRRFEE
jgi:ATP-dependent 26S proteasome regulatory subunit